MFKVTARDQGHYKGPSGAFVTYCNISCFKCLNATIPLTCTLANEYPSSNEISKKNGTVRGDLSLVMPCLNTVCRLKYLFSDSIN